jgi:hypothetical protein
LQQKSADSAPFGRVNQALSERHNGLSCVETFSNAVNFATGDGLDIVDTNSYRAARKSSMLSAVGARKIASTR